MLGVLKELSAVLLAVSLPSMAFAQQSGNGLSGSDCKQFLQAVEVAAEQNAKTEIQKRAAQAAQDEIIITVFWVHGYLTGKTGQSPTLDSAWIAGTVNRLSAICTTDGLSRMSIAEAAKQL